MKIIYWNLQMFTLFLDFNNQELMNMSCRFLYLFQAGLQALHFAAKMGHVDVVLELLRHGASINCTSVVRTLFLN